MTRKKNNNNNENDDDNDDDYKNAFNTQILMQTISSLLFIVFMMNK